MTKTELIAKLQSIEGDLTVKIYDHEQEYLFDIDEVLADKDYSSLPAEKVIVIS